MYEFGRPRHTNESDRTGSEQQRPRRGIQTPSLGAIAEAQYAEEYRILAGTPDDLSSHSQEAGHVATGKWQAESLGREEQPVPNWLQRFDRVQSAPPSRRNS
jgi:hypothetical protein